MMLCIRSHPLSGCDTNKITARGAKLESKIRVLSEQTINQIAAGEVIENAASVIKELVENSIDAGATEISVEINGGGRQLIRVRDNGCGMNADDALLCLERHATSKIQAVDDLHSLSSMGFRGEALPSIASISKFTLITAAQSHSKEGTIVLVEGGKILKCAPVDCATGTLIEIKDLFFNVPARRKFQKSPAHDIQEILKSLSLLALGNPGIRFELISNQKSLLKTSLSSLQSFQEQLKERISDVLGHDFLHEITPLESQRDEWRLQGFIGLPACTRHNRTGQFLFINRRAVVSPLISYAVRDGYGPALAPSRHPLFVLHFTLPGPLVDVNVHPQKREVRLRQEQAIREWVARAVEGALSQSSGVFESHSEISLEPYHYPNPIFAPLMTLSETLSNPTPTPSVPPQKAPETPSLFKVAPLTKTPSLRVITAFPGYIVAENPLNSGLSLIDQRAAHSRIIFEKLSNARENEIAVQHLLLPHTLELTPLESALLNMHLDGLNRVGIGIKEFGHHVFVIDALPQIFGNADIKAFLHDLLSEMHNWQPESALKQEKRAQIALAASRAAVSRNRRLTLEEAQTLVNQLMECSLSPSMPSRKTHDSTDLLSRNDKIFLEDIMNYLRRIDKLKASLPACPCDALIIEKEVDLYYLTGLKLSAGILLVHTDGAFLLVDSRYFELCKQSSPIPVLLSDKTPLLNVVKTREGIKLLGFDCQTTSYQRFLELQQLSPDIALQPVDSPVKKLRMIKDSEEILLLREAAALGAEGFDFVSSLLQEGVQEKDVALELEIFWKRRGAKAVGFEPIIAFGPNSAMPHYRNGETTLKRGMNALIDIGVNDQNYLSDMTRVLFLGEPDPTLRAIYAIVAQAQKEALSLCRPGTLIGEIDKAARNIIGSHGYGDFFSHSLGHGVGLEIHELPALRQKPPFQEMALQPGMVLTIEPGIYIPNLGGIRLEDTIAITKEGHDNLTNRPLLNF